MQARTAGGSRNGWLTLAALLLVVGILLAPDAYAQVDQTEARFKGVLDAFRDQSIVWQSTLMASARWLFMGLAITSFLWANFKLILKGGDAGEFISTNTQEVLRIGFMYILMLHGFDWATAVVMSFRQLGERAVSASAGAGMDTMDPAGIFQSGLVVAGSLFEQVSIWQGADNVGLVICALTLIICFAVLAAYMAVAIVESYLVIGGCVILLGFGGSSVTGDIAKRAAMYCVSVGAKLFVMQLIVGVTLGSVLAWTQTFENDSSTSTLSLVGLVLLITIMAKSVPETVQGLLSGTSFGGTGTMLATMGAVAAATAATGAAAATGVGGGGGAAAGAANSAGESMKAAGVGTSPTGGGAGSAGSMFSGASGHMARAASSMVDAAGGVNLGGALSSLSGGQRPDAPSMELGGGSNDGGTITGGGQPASPSEPTPGGGSGGGGGGGGNGASMGSGASPASASTSTASSGGAAAAPAAAAAAGAAAGAVSSMAGSSGHSPSAGGGADPKTLDQRSERSDPPSSPDAATSQASSSKDDDASAGTEGASAVESLAAASTSNDGGVARTASDDGMGAGVGGAGSTESATASSDPLSVKATLDPTLNAIGDAPSGEPLTLDERSNATSTLVGEATESAGYDRERRVTQAKRGAVVGAVIAGPAGAAIGALAGAAGAQHLDAIGAKAAATLAKAKAKFGL